MGQNRKKVLFWGADMCKFGTPSNEHHVKFNNLCFDTQYHASLHHHKVHFMIPSSELKIYKKIKDLRKTQSSKETDRQTIGQKLKLNFF